MGLSEEEFGRATIAELEELGAAWQQREKRLRYDADIREGRCFAALINFLGGLLGGKKYQPITAFHIFTEHDPRKKEQVEDRSEDGELPRLQAGLTVYFKAQMAAENRKKHEAALQRIKLHGGKT